MKTFLFYSILFLFSFFQLVGQTRYVSPNGNSTPPYTSWATAADSIQKAINISSSGDTIYVGDGTYKEKVTMVTGISLIGSGMDDCVIDTRELVTPTDFFAVSVVDSCLITGFQIVVSENMIGTGIASVCYSSLPQKYRNVVEHNKIINCDWGILALNSDSNIKDNIIVEVDSRGIKIDAFTSDYYPIIQNNYITTSGIGIQCPLGSSPAIINNIVVLQDQYADGFKLESPRDSILCVNNLVISENNASLGYYFSIYAKGPYANNVSIGKFSDYAFYLGPGNIAYNNLVLNAPRGMKTDHYDPEYLKYNYFWNVTTLFKILEPWGIFPPLDSTNVSVDPMLVNTDSLDFHLQKYSPLIDGGKPDVFDIDGTRSDAGLYGGPFGEMYQYLDLPPQKPAHIYHRYIDDNIISFVWQMNTEADLDKYFVYRDTVNNFIPGEDNFYIAIDTSHFVEDFTVAPSKVYYLVSAVDKEGNEGPFSDLVEVTVTGISNPTVNINESYELYQNYPNPFNPETTISYWLKEEGFVRLKVYDIKGGLLEVLINQQQHKGYHEVKFNGLGKNKLSGISSGIYLYSLEVFNKNNVPVFRKINKMILAK